MNFCSTIRLACLHDCHLADGASFLVVCVFSLVQTLSSMLSDEGRRIEWERERRELMQKNAEQDQTIKSIKKKAAEMASSLIKIK